MTLRPTLHEANRFQSSMNMDFLFFTNIFCLKTIYDLIIIMDLGQNGWSFSSHHSSYKLSAFISWPFLETITALSSSTIASNIYSFPAFVNYRQLWNSIAEESQLPWGYPPITVYLRQFPMVEISVGYLSTDHFVYSFLPTFVSTFAVILDLGRYPNVTLASSNPHI